MSRRGRPLVVLTLGALALVAGAYLVLRGHGFSAKAQPGRFETAVARSVRTLAMPADARRRTNPLPVSDEILAAGLAHYADHCAMCHANDGSGSTEMGSGLYPKPPDMRLPATQRLTDGELFYLIENGVPLTGMPGWGTGTAEGETASWHLVHFLRHLPRLTHEELERMEGLNPVSPEEWQQRKQEEEFLRGNGPAPPARRPAHQHGKQG